jgi:hypothetical protein
MHRQWPFFRTLLSNLDMVLAKSDLRIAARYVELVDDKRRPSASSAPSRPSGSARRSAVADHRRGWTPAVQPALARSIEHRFPYLDPLNHLQVELMRRYRSAARTRPTASGAARHPSLDQRDRGRVAQHRLSGRRPNCGTPRRRQDVRGVRHGQRAASRFVNAVPFLKDSARPRAFQ